MSNRQFRYLLTFLLTLFMAGISVYVLQIFQNETVVTFILGHVSGCWGSAVVFHYNGDDRDDNGNGNHNGTSPPPQDDEIPDRETI